ncbi:MAG: metallophosphoesterase [Myxococcota bacterium]|nr:metallophosphoesterase [Myxococcota bacterium]
MITLAHLSDLHATDPSRAGIAPLASKRFFGWLSWKLRRRKRYRRHVAEALIADLETQAADHVAVTGDLTNISLPFEFEVGASILRALGTPERISLVPGNHDAYVATGYEGAWQLWTDYLQSDAGEAAGDGPADPLYAEAFPAPLPTVRVRGDLALVGVCTAVATPPFMASGRVGPAQLERLKGVLEDLRERGLCRVVLVHHPVVDGHVSCRRRCSDAEALREVLENAGAELVLHGHNHRSEFHQLATRDGEIPVVGVRSGSYAGPNEEKTAQYHLYEIQPSGQAGARRFDVRVRVRQWSSDRGAFEDTGTPIALP